MNWLLKLVLFGVLMHFGLQGVNAQRYIVQDTCFGDSTMFRPVDGPEAYDSVFWNFGDVAAGDDSIGRGYNIKHRFTAPGTYLVKLKIFKFDQTDSVAALVNIIASPMFSLGKDALICKDGSIEIGVEQPDVTYLWDDGFTEPLRTVTDTGIYCLFAISDTNVCIWEDCIEISFIEDTLRAVAGFDKSVCLSGSVVLGGDPTASGGFGQYEYMWEPSEEFDNPQTDRPILTPTKDTSYVVTVTDSAGCIATDTVVVTISDDVAPLVDAGMDTTNCTEDSVTLQLGGTPTILGGEAPFDVLWSPATKLDDPNSTNPTVTLDTLMIYTITVLDNNGCVARDTIAAGVGLPPGLVDFETLDSAYCLNDDPEILVGTPYGGLFEGPGITMLPPEASVESFFYPDTSANDTIPDANFIGKAYPIAVEGELGDFLGEKTLIDSVCFSIKHAAIGDVSVTLVSPNGERYILMSRPGYPEDIFGCQNSDTLAVCIVPGTGNPIEPVCQDTIIGQFTGHNDIDLDSLNQGGIVPVGEWNLVVNDSLANDTGVLIDWSIHFSQTKASFNPMEAGVADSHKIKYTFEESLTCPAVDSQFVVVWDIPVVFAGFDTSICAGDTILAGGNPSAMAGTPPYEYAWDPNINIEDSTLSNPFVHPIVPTIYTLTVTDSNGCMETDLFDVTMPVADAGGPSVDLCLGDTVELGAAETASEGKPPYEYLWTPNFAIDDPTVANPVSFTLVDTSYFLTVIDSNGCLAFDTVDVIVRPLPIADAGLDTTICSGDPAEIGGNPTAMSGTEPYNYLWSPSMALSDSSIANPIASPVENVDYVLVVTDTFGCMDQDTVRVFTLELPMAFAGMDTTSCAGDSIQLGVSPIATGGVLPYSFSWSPGASISDSLDSLPMAAPMESTCFVLTVTDANGCIGLDTMCTSIPEANAGDDTLNVCEGQEATLGAAEVATGGKEPYTYSWTPDDGFQTSSDIANPSFIPTQDTLTYFVTITDGNGCSHTDSVVSIRNAAPIVDAGEDVVQLCEEGQISIGGNPSASGGGGAPYAFAWSPPIGLNSTNIGNPTVIDPVAITYTLVVTDVRGCVDSATTTIELTDAPTADAGGPELEVCETNATAIGGNPTASEGAGAPYTYLWSPDVEISSTTAENPEVLITASRTYFLEVTDRAGCVGFDTVNLVMLPKPTADAGADHITCVNVALEIGLATGAASGGSGAPYTFSWEPSEDFADATLSNPFISDPTESKVYTLVVTDAAGCMSDPATMALTVSTVTPQANAGADTAICEGVTFTLGGDPTAQGGIMPYTYLWEGDPSLSSTIEANPTATPTAAQTQVVYQLTVTDSIGCVGTDSKTVNISPNNVTVDAGAPRNVCQGDTVQIGGAPTVQGGTGPFTYTWEPAEGLDDATVANPNCFPETPINYTLNVEDAFGCLGQDLTFIQVQARPIANAGVDTGFCVTQTKPIGPLVNAATGGAGQPYSFQWLPSFGLDNANVARPMATLSSAESITYTLTVTDAAGCSSTDELTISEDCPTFVKIPNAFTPNGDGLNDQLEFFNVNLESYDFRIYNRWGKKVFETTHTDAQLWNGKIEDVDQPAGVYTYILIGTYFDGSDVSAMEKTGSVHLIR